MKLLLWSFLKIFFRNPRAWFFVIFLPALIFLAGAVLGLESIIQASSMLVYNDYLLVGIIAMAIMQTGVYGVTYLMIDWRKSQIFKRLLLTPLSAFQFLSSFFISRFAIACLQVAALLVLGVVIFGVKISGLWVLPIVIFIGLAIFLNLGYLIASLARDYEAAAPYTTITGLLLVFLGDVFFPAKNLPASLARLSQYLPLRPLSDTLRHVLLNLVSPDLYREILVLLIWFFISSVIAAAVFRKRIYR